MLNSTRQVLLEKWMDDYINLLKERYDLSISTIIRAHICLAILNIMPLLYPEFKTNSLDDKITNMAKIASRGELQDADVHYMLSELTFEARKAVQFRFSQKDQEKS